MRGVLYVEAVCVATEDARPVRIIRTKRRMTS